MSEGSLVKKAVILSGGLGTRLRPLTSVIPKPLLPIGEKSVLEIQIERLARGGFEEVILATNYHSEYIERYFGDGSDFGVRLVISKEEKRLGTAGPLSLVRDRLADSPFLMMNGDVLTLMDFADMYAFAYGTGSWFTAGIKRVFTPFRIKDVVSEGGRIVRLEERENMSAWALAGVYVLKPEVLGLVPDDTYYGVDDLMHDMMAKGLPIAKYEIDDYWLDIGRVEDFEKAQEDFQKHMQEDR